jgi:uncharacterized RDD family membrane protein YckC
MTSIAESPAAVGRYAGFWSRAAATAIDCMLFSGITIPITAMLGGEALDAQGWWASRLNLVVTSVLPAVATILFWIFKGATPGKMAVGLRVVDASTGELPSPRRCIDRYFAYFVSAIPLGLGFIWVGLDARNQGFHDKLARTVVVHRGPS